MEAVPPHPARRVPAGFTVLELLTACVVFCILVVLVARLMGLVQESSSHTQRQIDAGQEARYALDRLGGDLGQALFRPDVDFKIVSLDGNDTLAFLAQVPSYDSARKLALVSYRVRPGGLQRGVLSLDLDKMVFLPGTLETIGGANASAAPDEILPDAAYDPISSGILRAEFLLVGKDGGFVDSSAAWKPDSVEGVLVVFLITSKEARKLLADSDAVSLAAQFPDLTPSAFPQSPAASWNALIESPGFQAQPIPARVKQELRVCQRFYSLRP